MRRSAHVNGFPRRTSLIAAAALVITITVRTGTTTPPGPSESPTDDATNSPSTEPHPTAAPPTCTSTGCHDAMTQRPVTHAPAARGFCGACHVEVDAARHTFRDAIPRRTMCLSCHTLPARDVAHEPVARGDCTACHDPHGSEWRHMLRADPATELCGRCHADVASPERRHVHGPAAAGACILCHEAHASWHPALLRRAPRETCQECHADVRSAAQARRHVHAAFVEAACTECHDPHAGDTRSHLRGPVDGLCAACHEPIRRRLAESPVVHGAASGDEACIGCHAGHASDLPMLQRDRQPGLCLACHDRTGRDAAGRPLTNMAAWLRDNPVHHGPIRDGDCSACHDPHASTHARLLSADYPAEFYAPFAVERYALCFGCHRPELAVSPSGQGLTEFRHGDRNLHFVHVHREKGRTCRACHESHASNAPFHMRTAVPFGAGRWTYEINFQALPQGGSCAPGCHAPVSYDRDAVTTAPAWLPAGASP